jgi:hypothetical protein
VKANKEVTLSAGAIASPQLLLLSGVGPKKHLQEMGVSFESNPLRLNVGVLIFHVTHCGFLLTSAE